MGKREEASPSEAKFNMVIWAENNISLRRQWWKAKSPEEIGSPEFTSPAKEDGNLGHSGEATRGSDRRRSISPKSSAARRRAKEAAEPRECQSPVSKTGKAGFPKNTPVVSKMLEAASPIVTKRRS